MDPAVFEKLGAAVSDPEIQKKISAIISGDGTGMTSKPDAPCPPSSPPSPPAGRFFWHLNRIWMKNVVRK